MKNTGTLHRIALTALILGMLLVSASCLSTTAKRIIPSPWTPELSDAAGQKIDPPVNEVVPVHWFSDAPSIDGDFSEWEGLSGAVTRIVVFGVYHDPQDAEGSFVLATDGDTLFIYAEVTDDLVNSNLLPGSMAWRNDSVEVFFSTDISRHIGYRREDNQIRIVPRNPDDMFDYELAVNDITQTDKTEAAVVFTDTGYRIEAAIDLKLLRISGLSPGQRVRCEFQVNDGDDTERDRLVHWMSQKDDPWYDPSVWGNGKVGEGE